MLLYKHYSFLNGIVARQHEHSSWIINNDSIKRCFLCLSKEGSQSLLAVKGFCSIYEHVRNKPFYQLCVVVFEFYGYFITFLLVISWQSNST